MSNSAKSILFASLTILFWSTVATAFKIALKHCSIPQILFLASATSLVIMAIMIPFTGFQKLFSQSREELLRSALMGFINPFLYYLILFKAYSLLPAQIAQPINQIWPLILALLAVPLLHQKLPKSTLTSLVICFAGVAIISSQGHLNIFKNSSPAGIALALTSSVVWSLYWIVNVKDNRDIVIKLFTNFGFSVAYLLLLSPFVDGFFNFTTAGFFSSIYIGVFEMGLSFLFWLKALKHAKSAAKLGLMIYLIPFLSLFFIHFIAGEEIKTTTIAGLCLIVVGIVYQQKDKILAKN